MKKFIAATVAIALFFTLSPAALAADPPQTYSSVPTEGTPAQGNVGSAEGRLGAAESRFQLAAVSSVHICTWRNSIEEVSSGYLKLYGYTETDMISDQLENDYYLQRWDGSAWVTAGTSYNYKYDSDFFMAYAYRYVSLGSYYRVKTVHRAWNGSAYDSRTIYSSYIYVS